MTYEEITYSLEGAVAIITLNRPEAMNALTLKTYDELANAVAEADKDDNVRVIVITGAGKGFCSGVRSLAPVPGMISNPRSKCTSMVFNCS